MNYTIARMEPNDWEQVRAIYQEGISTGNATFDPEPPDWDTWDASHLPAGRLVARAGENILGWVALSPVSNRCVYAGIAEVSLYVGNTSRRQGIGSSLLATLIESSEKAGIWSLEANIFPENEASMALARRHGFREVGRREKLGKMTFGEYAGIWRDVLLMERRSKVAGTN